MSVIIYTGFATKSACKMLKVTFVDVQRSLCKQRYNLATDKHLTHIDGVLKLTSNATALNDVRQGTKNDLTT
jgi:hypothetical protein